MAERAHLFSIITSNTTVSLYVVCSSQLSDIFNNCFRDNFTRTDKKEFLFNSISENLNKPVQDLKLHKNCLKCQLIRSFV